MLELLDHPAVQGGIAPLVVALVVAAALARTRFSWLAIVAGYATMIRLSTGFSFSPLTSLQKVVLLGLAMPLAGMAADLAWKRSGFLAPAFAAAGGGLSLWAFVSVLRQREGTAAHATTAGIALFAAALVWLVLRLRADGLRAGAAGLGLGLATGIAGVLSASIGFFGAGASIAAGAGALLLVQVIFSRNLAAGYAGTLAIGFSTALFAVGTLLLAELRWYVLPLLLLVPLAATLPVPGRAPQIVRAAILSGYALLAAAIPILGAWFAARGSLS